MNSKISLINKNEITDIVDVNNDVDIYLYKILAPAELFCFFAKYKSARLLEKSWSKLNSSIASYFQSKLTNEFQIWNMYIVFTCEDDVTKEIKYKIENDRFSSRKIVLDNIESLNESIIKDIIINKITNTNLELEQKKDQKNVRSLKIKKVEIDAFRAFKSKEDGTFDFTLENDECADFISIYAPNGFGKTSFYDAVEWGLTGNIYRLLRSKELAKEERSQSEIKEGERVRQYILKNREASSVKGTVRIQTLTEIIENETKKVTRRGQTDYDFIDDTPDKKKYFRDIILSQDGIDSFIKEDKPEDRYNKFIDFFGDKDLDTEYNSIEENIKKNKDELSKLRSEIKELKNKIAIEVDTKIFEGINQCIDLLNSNGEKIPHVNESFDERKEQKLQELIESRKLYFIAESKRSEEEIEKLKNILSKREWLNIQIKDKTNLESKKIKLESISRDINIKSETEKKLSFLKEELSKKIEFQKVFFEIKKILPEYHSIQSKLNSLQNKKVSLKGDLNENEELRLNFIRDRNQYSQNIKSLTEEKLKIKELLTNAPSLFLALETKTKELQKIRDEKANIERPLEFKRIKQGNMHVSGERLKQIIEDIDNKIYTDLKNYLTENQFENFNNRLVEISDIELKIEKLNKNIKNIENTTLEQKELDSDLQKLIDIGSKIIHDTKTSRCPLCNNNNEEDTYETLINRISSNPLLNKTLQKFVEEKAEIEYSKLSLNNRIKELQKKLIDFITKKLDEINKNLMNIKEKISSDENKISVMNTHIQNLSKELEELTFITKSKSKKEYLEKLNKQLNEIKGKFEKVENGIAAKDKDIKDLNQIISNINLSIERIESGIEILNEKDILKKIQDYQKKFNEAITDEYVENSLKTVNSDIDKIKIELVGLEKKIKNYSEMLSSVDIKNIKNEYDSVVNKLNQIVSPINACINEILMTLQISDLDTFDENIQRKLESLLKSSNKLCEKNSKLLTEFATLNSLITNVKPYLKHLEYKREKALKDVELERKEGIETELRNRQTEIANKLKEMIDSFFHQDLINKLYQKIDPHPEYHTIEFKANFPKDSKPKLNVFVKNKEDSSFISPNLYFSTAQLNILSLSIFLAKALNAKDNNNNPVDCIFLDDPIHSLDSINMLSTIDLLRSLVVNHKKQIILSTHDENFFLLLQKKIPSGLMKAKYIELETFGKVKKANEMKNPVSLI